MGKSFLANCYNAVMVDMFNTTAHCSSTSHSDGSSGAFCTLLFIVFASAIGACPPDAAGQTETGQAVVGRSPSEALEPVPAPSVIAAEQQRVAAMQRAAQATVGVFGVDGQGGGSGVCITPDGYVLTNFHVSSPIGYRMRCGMNDGVMYDAVVVGIDPTGDLAVLKMFGRQDFPVATIGDSDQVRVGQWCFAAGNPFVLATNLQPTITYGLVSGVRRYQYPSGTILEYSDCIQTDAAINPGNSGGPLFNAQGELIGINGRCSFEKRGRVNVGVGYAISVRQAINFFWHLRSGRIVDHATLGFTVATDPKGRVVVSNILESSDAYRRGLRYGDEILRLADRDIATTNQLKNVLGIFPNQWRIPLRFRNDIEVIDTFVRLQNLHLPVELEEIVQGESAPERAPPPRSPQEEDEKEAPGVPDASEDASKASDASKANKDRWAEWYETRRGFSNYHFNRLEIDRVTSSNARRSAWDTTGPVWAINGKVAGETTPLQILCSDATIAAKTGDREEAVGAKLGWIPWIQQRSTLPLALGVRVWQQWHRVGPRKMGEAVYIGRSPLVNREGLFDTTRVAIGELDAVVYTDPDSGSIACIELTVDNQTDPAEIYFEKYRSVDGRSIPTQIRLAFGLETRTAIEVDTMDWNAPIATEGND
jgi:S1-C subfamily serine protease